MDTVQRPPAATLPYVRHIADIRSELEANGLPSRADGVRVFVPDLPGHKDDVARTINGHVGLARGAKVFCVEIQCQPDPWLHIAEELSEADQILYEWTAGKHVRIQDLAYAGVCGLARTFYEYAFEIHKASVMHDESESVGLVNISWGRSIASECSYIMGLVAMDDPEVRWAISNEIYNQVRSSSELLSAGQKYLSDAVAKARAENILVFMSKGNVIAGDPAWWSQITGYTPGIIPVGAAGLVRSGSKYIMRPALLTPPIKRGLTAPGLGVPVGVSPNGDPVELRGTSYAAPYALSVAALMVKANSTLNPAAIEEILLRTASPDSGQLMVNPVAAVKAAKNGGKDE